MGQRADLSGAEQARAGAEQACARGESSLARGGFEAAEREFRAALALAGGRSDDGGRGDEMGGDEGDDGRALRGRALVGLGRVRLAAGDAEQGAVEFRRAHELRPEASGPLHWLGCAAAHRAAYESAEEYFTSALGCVSSHRRSLVQRAYVRVRLRRYEDALGDLRAADGAGTLDAQARSVLAVLSGGGGAAGGLALELRRAALDELGGAGEFGGRTDGLGVRTGGLGSRTDGLGRVTDVSGGRGTGGTRTGRAARLLDVSRSLPGPVGVEREFVPLYAVILVLGGRREAAVELLEDAARRDPADHRITHTLALALLNSAEGEAGSEEGAAARRWERCVAAWGALLHDDTFWEHRRASAEARFGVPLDVALDLGLRADLRELLERRMPQGDAGGRVPPGALLQREADAARILAGAGGFPAGRGGSPLVGGPLRIAGLGLVGEFGTFAATVTATATPSAPGSGGGTAVEAPGSASTGESAAAQSQLTYAFSELGFAQLLLKQDKPADAIAALAELRCRACRERKSGSDSAGVAAAICEPDCGRFDELNPAYAGHLDKHHRLARDARGLALRARLDLGRRQLAARRPDFGAAAVSWRRALVHGRELERYRETQAAVVDLALGLARAAHRAGDPTRAVDTLEAVRAITGANERGRLEGQLARLLADRGISSVNRDGTLLDAPAADLRRSVAFNPHLLRAQVSLGVVLRGLAARRWRSGSVSGARDTLREALDRLTSALVHFPDDPELTEQRDAILADLRLVTAEQQESGR